MTAIDLFALLNQAGALINTVAPILSNMHAEGRTEPTPEEVAKVRAHTLASEQRLEAATS